MPSRPAIDAGLVHGAGGPSDVLLSPHGFLVSRPRSGAASALVSMGRRLVSPCFFSCPVPDRCSGAKCARLEGLRLTHPVDRVPRNAPPPVPGPPAPGPPARVRPPTKHGAPPRHLVPLLDVSAFHKLSPPHQADAPVRDPLRRPELLKKGRPAGLAVSILPFKRWPGPPVPRTRAIVAGRVFARPRT